jgi:hypothetical protein
MIQQHTPPLHLFITFALLLARASANHSSCYIGDGAEDTGSQPCPESNMCCYLDRTDGYADDVCIQGACYSNYWTGQYFVVGCTSQNWDEGSGCSPLWDVCGPSHLPKLFPRVTDGECWVVSQDTPTSHAVMTAVSVAAIPMLRVVTAILGYI